MSSDPSTCYPDRVSSGRRSCHDNRRDHKDSPRRRRRRATYTRTQGVRHLLAALDLNRDQLYGHVKTNKNRTTFLAFLPLPALGVPPRR